MTQRSIISFLLALAGAGGLSPAADGQVYCALRDPVTQIYDLYPEATSYRSIVRTVDAAARDAVDRRLPFQIHFNELGRHTLYVALDGSRPRGLIHVRSEKGRWGMIEICWSLDLDLRVRDYRFQRCRSPQRGIAESKTLRDQIIGRSIEDLEALLTIDGTKLAPGGLEVAPEARALALTVVRSALKTIAVTDLVWGDDLDTVRMIDVGLGSFPGAATVEQVLDVYSPEILEVLGRAGAAGAGIDRVSTIALRARDTEEAVLGHAVRTDLTIDGRHADVWWIVTKDMVIERVVPRGEAADPAILAALQTLQGFSIHDLGECATVAELAGVEVLTICAAQRVE